MLETNPFSLLSEVVPTVVMQGFIIAMVLLIAFGTIIQMIHHKNLILRDLLLFIQQFWLKIARNWQRCVLKFIKRDTIGTLLI